MRRTILAIVSAAGLLAGLQASVAEVLITKAEAELPTAPGAGSTTRGLTRGPGIEQLSPNPAQNVTSPVAFRVKFVTRNNVPIDPASVKLTYLKATPVDVTDRIKSHVTPDGIEMSDAEVPPGTHMMRLDVADQQGRSGTAVIKFVVAGR